MTTASIEQWHQLARPNPTEQQFNVQLGCHFEEIREMLDTLCFAESSWMTLRTELESLADALKSGRERATIIDRKGFADSVGDQVVTVIGAAYCADMKGHEICTRVDQSNWSKFVDGKPVFFPNGKIAKSEGYRPPNLEGTY